MCGIIAVLIRRSRRRPPSTDELRGMLGQALRALPDDDRFGLGRPDELAPALLAAADRMRDLDRALLGVPGVLALRADRGEVAAEIEAAAASLQQRLAALEGSLDAGVDGLTGTRLEETNAALIRLKDATWSVRQDRLRTYRAVDGLAGGDAGEAAIRVYLAVQIALSALDRLEVRGRDSAGVHVFVRGHGLDIEGDAPLRDEIAARSADPLFGSGSVRVTPEGHLSFVYKAAAEIGELGDNTRVIRSAILSDTLLRRALGSPAAEGTVLGHTRWASVGIISQANAHPLNQEESAGGPTPYVVAALNGDVDNYADLKAAEGMQIAPEITTDAKVIPVSIARRMREGLRQEEAFRSTVASFDGSVAIAAGTARDLDTVLLALRGSGQALYVGLAEDAFVVASEPYGVVEDCARYVRMDGETPGNLANPEGSRGQVVALRRALAGELAGIERMAYDGTPLPLRAERDVALAAITTRDIDRGTFPHFLLKEITEAPRSLHKTLRGRIVEAGSKLRVQLGDDALPAKVRERLRRHAIARIVLIGQGTAAVAAQGAAAAFETCLRRTAIGVRAMPATELSGFAMREDMSDTLVVAISQSGTTTDTNRTVDLVRQRGAAVVAIVNRRGSDLCDKADGVLFTSDGRDIEMSVASTKAFYAQVAAGFLLALAVAREAGSADDGHEHRLLTGLRQLPDAMQQVLARSEQIAQVARRHVTKRRYWALVGNGRNRVAAQEVRIKLSELCYKAIPCDATEDKKHIDLSSEPLVLVCAAGLNGSTAADVGKEVAIYKAHKGLPIVIATDGEDRYRAAADVITVPAVPEQLGFVLATVAGHLFGYHAALAIDATARPLREARGAIEATVSGFAQHARSSDELLAELAPRLRPPAERFLHALAAREYDGSLEASTATRLASLLRFSLGELPLEAYEAAHGSAGTPAALIEALTLALTRAIDELTRPVDAIKHQAKTVTVGISRSDEALLTVPLVQELFAAGAPRERIRYADLRTLAALQPAVRKVLGHTRYKIDGDPDSDAATVQVVDRGGIARELPSRTEREPVLRGTKHSVARTRRLVVARGASDGRTVVIVPEVQGSKTVGITLLHVAFHHNVAADAMRGVLHGYHDRLAALRDAVMETEAGFDESRLASVPAADLLCESVRALADRWRAA